MTLLIGIDDTDNRWSKGTGHRARQMGLKLMNAGLADLFCITRHQLLVDKRIPFTSHNSSACLLVNAKADKEEIIIFCRKYLKRAGAFFSDVGLCVAEYEKVHENVVKWGNDAKKIILTKEQAHSLATSEGIHLEGLTGKKIGVIGSLAAVGLRKEGNDGRVLWLNQLRELRGVHLAGELKKITRIESIISMEGTPVEDHENIDLGEWCRPMMKNNKITLITQEDTNNGKCKWKVAPKEHIKSITE